MQRGRVVRAVLLFVAVSLACGLAGCTRELPFARVKASGDTAFVFGLESFRTDDRGATWMPFDTPFDDDEYLPAEGHERFSVVGDRLFFTLAGGLFVSRDAGRTWIGLGLPPRGIFTRVHFFDAFHGVAQTFSSRDRELVSTRDGGKTWKAFDLHRGLLVSAAESADRYYLLVGSQLHESRDQGQTWRPLGTARDVDTIRVLDDELWMLGSAHCERMKLVSGETHPCGIPRRDVGLLDAARHQNRLLVSTWEGTLFTSVDGGATWNETRFAGQQIVSVDFFGDGTAIAVGGHCSSFMPFPDRILLISEDLVHWREPNLPAR